MRLWGHCVVALACLAGWACVTPPSSAADAGIAEIDAGESHLVELAPTCLDNDGDGAPGTGSCAGLPSVDCADSDPSVFPGAPERCNDRDDNCDGRADEGLSSVPFYGDRDGDGVGREEVRRGCGAPPPGMVLVGGDCDDSKATAFPGAPELCNGADDNCNGQIDEGNPGGGASCSTTLPGVCGAGTVACVSGIPSCVRLNLPSAEKCDGFDNDCDNEVDEDFANKGSACTAGLGVCQKSGTFACKADGSATECSAVAGTPTAPACDGLDNDCDGVADEPAITQTADMSTTAFSDIEVAPTYFSQSGCAGGAMGSGTDALIGGGLVMAGSGGMRFQPLSALGEPMGTATSLATLSYGDVALAQAGDGFVVAALYQPDSEVDLYYVDATTGAKRIQLWQQFGSFGTIDSLRVVRGNGRRVSVIWRDSSSGLRLAHVEPVFDGTTWKFQKPGGGALTAVTLLSGQVVAGLGVDSAHVDWLPTQSCAPAASLQTLGVAYLAHAQSLRHFTVLEDGSGKSPETLVRAETGTLSSKEPEVLYFEAQGSPQWFVAFTTSDSGSLLREDLNYWLTTDPVWHFTYFNFATDNGADSVRRPRASATAQGIELVALRYVPDPSGLKRQMMSRRLDLTGARVPAAGSAELSALTGSCAGGDPDCRPGNKDALTVWGKVGRVYYSGTGAAPAGTFSSVLSCR